MKLLMLIPALPLIAACSGKIEAQESQAPAQAAPPAVEDSPPAPAQAGADADADNVELKLQSPVGLD